MSEVEPQPPPTCEVCHKQMWWHGSTYGYGCPDSAAGEKECRSKLYRPYREGDR
jgi:hypothetical protein